MHNNSMPIKFGTDGWRGIIAEDFTFDSVRLCARATAESLLKQPEANPVAVIGYDTRFASQDFARAAAEVLAASGVKVIFSDSSCPTPVLSHATTTFQASVGIAITASHNPAKWNGFKLKAPDGSSAPENMIKAVEKYASNSSISSDVRQTSFVEGVKNGLIEMADFNPPYYAKMAELVDLENLKKAQFKACFDPMYGAGAGYLKQLVEGGNMAIIEMNSNPNPAFPGIKQPEPIAPNLEKLSNMVTEINASVGLATDGDADRLGIIDEKGRFLNTLQVYSLLALYLLEVRGERGPIVKTITSSAMLDRLGEIYNVPVFEVQVGFKNVAPVMIRENAMIGGEESGGYGYRGHIPERDGILSALYFLDYMIKTGKYPSELVDLLYQKVGPHFYDRIDIEFPPRQKPAIIDLVEKARPETLDGAKVVKRDKLDGFRFSLDDNSWLLIRFSGTEPLLRIYSEASSKEKVEKLLEAGREMAGLRQH